MNEVERRLLKVAENVAKHLIQRGGWRESDPCFGIDLREAQAAIEALIAAERDEAVRLRKALEDVALRAYSALKGEGAADA